MELGEIEIIDINPDNIAEEHICCAFSDKKSVQGYQDKKDWLTAQYANGYRFKRLDARGKIMIEYVPAEHAWLPLDAPDYMVVNCFWVSGKFKKHGNAKRLLQECLNDAAEMNGVVAVTGDKKRPFMSDPKFLKKQGFECVDEAPPYFRLWCKKLKSDVPTPQFKDTARQGGVPGSKGILAYYTSTCPFAAHWTNGVLREYAAERGIPCEIHKIETREQAHALPIPWIINSVFYDGELVTLELASNKALDELLGEE
jgi:hypothetical protein